MPSVISSTEIRSRFLEFFKKRGHTIISSASLVPENDPSVLFNTAGMQPLVPYLLGENHPGGKRLVDSQKCVRTVDIDEIGDNTHATFFEMLGNWSLGDYFKTDAITWSFQFLTSKSEGLGLDPSRLYVTVFGGNSDAPKDDESYAIWEKLFSDAGVTGERIYFMTADAKGKEPNWWSPGENGPCGPDSEMFYDVSGTHTSGMTKGEYMASDDRQEVVEIWNDVFMEYVKRDGVVVSKLEKQNVDTGSGLERLVMVVQGKNNIFETDLLEPLVKLAGTLTDEPRKQRIIADHLRTAVFLIADGVRPSNTDQGYVLRRLLRRAVIATNANILTEEMVEQFVMILVGLYGSHYTNIATEKDAIAKVINAEITKFSHTLSQGLREFNKYSNADITGKVAFDLFQTFGFPFEVTAELIAERGFSIDKEGYTEELVKHQDVSRQGSEQKFKGGLADTSEMSVKYHTATHLLHEALRQVLGDHVLQKGSNITPERLRFDFSHGEKMTDEQKIKVENIINNVIAEALPVTREEVSYDEARTRGAIGVFDAKYGETVTIYTVGEVGKRGEAKLFSLEFCGGPHVTNTKTLGKFKIAKEEACSAGVRRIKAVLE